METTGGTDVDWMVERNGGFILLEMKGINQNNISIKWGQLLAFRSLYKKLSSDGKCHFLVIGHEDIDYKNPESVLWYFDMQDFVDNRIPSVYDKRYKRLVFHKSAMKAITLREFREIMEKYWKEFGKKKIDLKPKSQSSTSKISKKEKAISDAKNFLLEKSQEYSSKEQLLSKTKEMLRAYHHLRDIRLENYLKIALSDLKVKHNFSLDENNQKEKAYSIKEIRKTYPRAYEKWTESDDKLMKKFWKENKQSKNDKILLLMLKFGRKRGAIISRLNKMGFDLEKNFQQITKSVNYLAKLK